MMSSLRQKTVLPFPRWVKILLALVPLSGLVAGAARATVKTAANLETRSHADSVYLRKDTFAIKQAGAVLSHQRDSLVYDAQFSQINTSLAALVRACQKRGECP